MVKTGHAILRDVISKISNVNRVDNVTQVVENHPIKCEALSLSPSSTKNNEMQPYHPHLYPLRVSQCLYLAQVAI
jgi:hypothetical protein